MYIPKNRSLIISGDFLYQTVKQLEIQSIKIYDKVNKNPEIMDE